MNAQFQTKSASQSNLSLPLCSKCDQPPNGIPCGRYAIPSHSTNRSEGKIRRNFDAIFTNQMRYYTRKHLEGAGSFAAVCHALCILLRLGFLTGGCRLNFVKATFNTPIPQIHITTLVDPPRGRIGQQIRMVNSRFRVG